MAAFDAARRTKSLPVIPSRTSLWQCRSASLVASYGSEVEIYILTTVFSNLSAKIW